MALCGHGTGWLKNRRSRPATRVSGAIPAVSQSGGTRRPPAACSHSRILQYACLLIQIHADEHRHAQMILVADRQPAAIVAAKPGHRRCARKNICGHLCSSVCIFVKMLAFRSLAGLVAAGGPAIRQSGAPVSKVRSSDYAPRTVAIAGEAQQPLDRDHEPRNCLSRARPVAERPTSSTGCC